MVRASGTVDVAGTIDVNGQSGYTSYVIELPLRSVDDGSLHFTPALEAAHPMPHIAGGYTDPPLRCDGRHCLHWTQPPGSPLRCDGWH